MALVPGKIPSTAQEGLITLACEIEGNEADVLIDPSAFAIC